MLGKYQITYECGTIQVKNLISHEDYVNEIKPELDKAYKYGVKNKKDPRISKIKNYLNSKYGSEWFTNKSPLFKGISTGVLSLLTNDYKCKVEKC